ADEVRDGGESENRQGDWHRTSDCDPATRRRGDRMILRRDFIKLLGGTAAILPLAARAQQTMPVIGFLSNGFRQSDETSRCAPLRGGLKESGYVEGHTVASEYRWAEGQNDRLPELAADLLRRYPAMIVALGGPIPSLAAKRASMTVPVLFTIVGDPVELGLVASFNRPGGNVTGVASIPDTVVTKQLEALHETVSTALVIGCLMNPDNPNTKAHTSEAQEAARTLGRKLELLYARNETEIERTFATLTQK